MYLNKERSLNVKLACKWLVASSGNVVKKASVTVNMLLLNILVLSLSSDACN